MTTINGETHVCCGNGTVGITRKARNSIKVHVLVVPRKPLNFGWLVVGFYVYGISTFLGYLMPNPFLYE